jgi:hypothetical protein
MYSTCLFCHSKLGANQEVEHFPVGRRLAFDAARGRLWVVCPSCGRWNLSPVEERWEAIEECERSYRGTQLQASTEQIGLAALPGGMELIRIGDPERPEFAAWRYGRRFAARRRRQLLWTGAAVAAGGALCVAFPPAALATGGGLAALNLGANGLAWYYAGLRTAARVWDDDGGAIDLTLHDLHRARVVPDDAGWALVLPRGGTPAQRAARLRPRLPGRGERVAKVRLTGTAALRAAGLILPSLNRYAGSARGVADAVRFLEEAGSADLCFTRSLKVEKRLWMADRGALPAVPAAVRLALEMAAHEDAERVALHGELRQLEEAWREAEEIAAIADGLLLPSGVEEFIRRHRSTPGGS